MVESSLLFVCDLFTACTKNSRVPWELDMWISCGFLPQIALGSNFCVWKIKFKKDRKWGNVQVISFNCRHTVVTLRYDPPQKRLPHRHDFISVHRRILYWIYPSITTPLKCDIRPYFHGWKSLAVPSTMTFHTLIVQKAKSSSANQH